MNQDNLPPVGVVCEVELNGVWQKVEVLKYVDSQAACILMSDNLTIVNNHKKGDLFWIENIHDDGVKFRAIKSEADLFIERLTPLLDFDIFTGQVTASFLWGIGLRFKD